MKKLLALVLVFVLTLSMGVPTLATEVSPEDMTQEAMEALAFDYFPEEYAMAIEAASVNCVRDGDDNNTDYVVVSETKDISDTETITYLQLSSGRSAFVHNVNFIDNSSSSGSNYTTVDTSVAMMVVGYSGVLCVNSFNYTIYTNSYDKINSTGNTLGSTNGVTVRLDRQTENSSGSATATYSMLFENSFTSAMTNIILQIYVGNNQRSYAVY